MASRGGGGGGGAEDSPSLGSLLAAFHSSSIDAVTRASIQERLVSYQSSSDCIRSSVRARAAVAVALIDAVGDAAAGDLLSGHYTRLRQLLLGRGGSLVELLFSAAAGSSVHRSPCGGLGGGAICTAAEAAAAVRSLGGTLRLASTAASSDVAASSLHAVRHVSGVVDAPADVRAVAFEVLADVHGTGKNRLLASEGLWADSLGHVATCWPPLGVPPGAGEDAEEEAVVLLRAAVLYSESVVGRFVSRGTPSYGAASPSSVAGAPTSPPLLRALDSLLTFTSAVAAGGARRAVVFVAALDAWLAVLEPLADATGDVPIVHQLHSGLSALAQMCVEKALGRSNGEVLGALEDWDDGDGEGGADADDGEDVRGEGGSLRLTRDGVAELEALLGLGDPASSGAATASFDEVALVRSGTAVATGGAEEAAAALSDRAAYVAKNLAVVAAVARLYPTSAALGLAGVVVSLLGTTIATEGGRMRDTRTLLQLAAVVSPTLEPASPAAQGLLATVCRVLGVTDNGVLAAAFRVLSCLTDAINAWTGDGGSDGRDVGGRCATDHGGLPAQLAMVAAQCSTSSHAPLSRYAAAFLCRLAATPVASTAYGTAPPLPPAFVALPRAAGGGDRRAAALASAAAFRWALLPHGGSAVAVARLSVDEWQHRSSAWRAFARDALITPLNEAFGESVVQALARHAAPLLRLAVIIRATFSAAGVGAGARPAQALWTAGGQELVMAARRVLTICAQVLHAKRIAATTRRLGTGGGTAGGGGGVPAVRVAAQAWAPVPAAAAAAAGCPTAARLTRRRTRP
ncbi:hypothetical protein BU14_0386s0002 [Porphyra umbilicalis]|uniref:Uncharacterized protein n=1 Tax=Porphyra umbilicalis TaxID=2786 RepID=A0A1X6NWQ2_PORUM|nr:hypothetical protein BU14_0386s0002 [Porphyra umbilicalis]|eukprot:OSX73002.1 hypothetical protein BU14_0386s0002 [Porphyra umbilicalis]